MKKCKYYLLLSLLLLLFTGGCSNVDTQSTINDKEEIKNEISLTEGDTSKVIDENKEEPKNKIDDETNNDQKEEPKEDIETAIIKEKKTIVIDPGHSSVGNPEKEPISPNSTKTKTKDVLGATGQYTNIPEHITTVSISLALKDELESRGYNVIMTKSEVSQSLSNIERANIGNDNNADLVVRIHADSSENSSIKGASILIPSKSENTNEIFETSKNYGEKIINTYTKELNLNNRGVIQRDDMTGFNWSKVPVVILEMGFLSNKEDDTFISEKQNHNQIAKSIANGIYSCFE